MHYTHIQNIHTGRRLDSIKQIQDKVTVSKDGDDDSENFCRTDRKCDTGLLMEQNNRFNSQHIFQFSDLNI